MEINALIRGIRGGDEDAVRELIRLRGADVLAHAMALCSGDRSGARAVTTQAFRNAVAHIRAFPEETFDETALCARIDAELLEAARTYGSRSVGEIASGEGLQSIRPQQTEEVPPRPASADRRRRRKTRLILAFILLLPCAIAALWLLYGIIASMGWLPYADLGYTWFNRAVFQIF